MSIFAFGCETEKPIGGERDEHGCLGPAGYSWCESKQKCLRVWEEGCSDGEDVAGEECSSVGDCDKCGNDCVPLSMAVVADCQQPTEDFDCTCDENQCKKVEKYGECTTDNDCIINCVNAYCDNGECKCGEIEKKAECTTNNDCIRGGCSGTICQSKDAEPMFTTCEFLPEYSCYKQINCGCVNGECEWGKTSGFDRCVEAARESDIGSGRDVIV